MLNDNRPQVVMDIIEEDDESSLSQLRSNNGRDRSQTYSRNGDSLRESRSHSSSSHNLREHQSDSLSLSVQNPRKKKGYIPKSTNKLLRYTKIKKVGQINNRSGASSVG